MAVKTKIQIRRDTAANWTSTNPTLAEGELGFETNSELFKIGNGSNDWNSLSYFNQTKLTANSQSTGLDTYDRQILNNNAALFTSGGLFLSFFTPSENITISSITFVSGSTNVSGTPTLVRIGLFTYDETTLTLVAATASDTNIGATANTAYTRSLSTDGSLPSTYQLVRGNRYAIGLLQVGATNISGVGCSGSNNVLSSLPPRLSGTVSGLSDLPTSTTSVTNTTSRPWFRVTV